MWLCRDEAVSVLPTVLIVVVGVPVVVAVRAGSWRRIRQETKAVLRRAAPLGIVVALIALAFVGPIVAVTEQNRAKYGVGLSNDLGQGAVATAFGQWQRVEVGGFRQDIPISAEQRRAVYRVSPAARRLAANLESPNNPWRVLACPRSPHACDIPGFATVWALRGAAAAAGQYRSGPASQRFFRQLAAQIQTACSSKRLRCATQLPASMQPLTQASVGALSHSFARLLAGASWPTNYFNLQQRARQIPQHARTVTAALVPATASTPAAAAAQTREFLGLRWPYSLLAGLYRVLIPLLLATSLVAVLVMLFRRNRRRAPLLILATAFAVGVVARTALLAVIDVVEFSTAQPRYGIPTHMFLIGFAVSGLVLLLDRPEPPERNARLVAQS
jgi:hypothetical protein